MQKKNFCYELEDVIKYCYWYSEKVQRTHLDIEKLFCVLYFIQGVFLADYDEPCFDSYNHCLYICGINDDCINVFMASKIVRNIEKKYPGKKSAVSVEKFLKDGFNPYGFFIPHRESMESVMDQLKNYSSTYLNRAIMKHSCVKKAMGVKDEIINNDDLKQCFKENIQVTSKTLDSIRSDVIHVENTEEGYKDAIFQVINSAKELEVSANDILERVQIQGLPVKKVAQLYNDLLMVGDDEEEQESSEIDDSSNTLSQDDSAKNAMLAGLKAFASIADALVQK